MRGLDDLVRDGKVYYIVSQIRLLISWRSHNKLADLQSLSPVVAIQIPYPLIRRDLERELFRMGKDEDAEVTAWGLLGGGEITGKYREVNLDKRYESASEDRMAFADKVVEIADKVGRTPSQVAINWVRQQQDKAQISR